jgi:hypothetical protein
VAALSAAVVARVGGAGITVIAILNGTSGDAFAVSTHHFCDGFHIYIRGCESILYLDEGDLEPKVAVGVEGAGRAFGSIFDTFSEFSLSICVAENFQAFVAKIGTFAGLAT